MKRYDQTWFVNIRDCYLAGKSKKALKFINEYLDIYPNDYHAYTLKITLLIKLGMIAEAEELLDKIVKEDSSDFDYALKKYRIAFKKDDYKTAYDLLKYILSMDIDLDEEFLITLKFEKIFLEKKLGYEVDLYDEDNITYTAKQLNSYDENLAIEHINKHTVEDERKVRHTVFEQNLNIEELFYKVKDRIDDSIYHVNDGVMDVYIFIYPLEKDAFFIDKFQYKYLKVITIKDTSKIVTMYPIYTNNAIKEANLFEKENKKLGKIIKMSQIDKFKRKYGNC